MRGQWAVDAALGTPVLLVGGQLLWRRAPFGYVVAAPLLFVSGVGGLAFAAAAVLDRALGGAASAPAVVGVHLAILASTPSCWASSPGAAAHDPPRCWSQAMNADPPRGDGRPGRAPA